MNANGENIHVKLEFNHPKVGVMKLSLEIKNLDDLKEHLGLDPDVTLMQEDDTIYACLPEDTFTDIGKVVNAF